MPLFIFNTSFYVSDLHCRQWEQWLEFELFSAIALKFPGLTHEVFEIVSVNSGNNKVFSVQWRCLDLNQTQELNSFMVDLLGHLTKQFGEEVTHFNSIMKKI